MIAKPRLAAALGLTLLAAACADEPSPPEPAAPAPSELRPHASLILEPATLELGEVAELEIVVSTPAGQRVVPMELPELSGLWLLERRDLAPEQGVHRWLHRIRLRVRPRGVGSHTWPAMAVTVEDEVGRRSQLPLAERRFEVVSARAQFPDRTEPFGLQQPGEVTQSWGWGALLTSAAAGALLASFLPPAWRRLRASGERPLPRTNAGDETVERPADWASRRLEEIRRGLNRDPRAAANSTAALLRTYMDRRYGTDIEGATTPELEAGEPYWFLQSRWPAFLDILRALDRERFVPATSIGRPSNERLGLALERAERLIDDSRDGG